MEGTIVTLSQPTVGTEIATFEEAFGEYSEARGRGRKRRKAKKAARKSRRSGRKKGQTRRATRQTRKQARIADRMARKQQRKTGRRTARQQARMERAKMATARKRMKAEERAARREMRRGPEEEYEEPFYDESGYDYEDEPYEQDGYGEDGYEDEYDDYGDDYGDDYVEDDYGDDYGDDQGDDYGDAGEWADEDYDDYDDEDWGYFDAISGVDGKMQVNPRLQKITDKIEVNKEWISRARVKLDEIKGRANPRKIHELKRQINKRIDRVNWLENKLAAFKENSTTAGQGRERGAHIGMARRKSVNARMEFRNRSKGVTPVEADLDPEISRDKIEIPASNATGIHGLDLQDDFDAPNARIVELTSNADGDKKKIPWKPILIGVGVGLVAIGVLIAIKKRKGK